MKNERKHESAELEKIDMKGGKTDYEFVLQIAVIAILTILVVYNAGKLYGGSSSGIQGSAITSILALDILPKGTPAVYGEELGVKYDDVSTVNPQLADATIEKLTAYEDKELSSVLAERYLKIGSSIACEYCCGAQSLVFSNGERACGCAHSYAMRGLAKYLLINHPEMSDLEILSELGKWKVLFFPGIHEQKAQALEANGIDYTDYVNLASNKYRGIENEAPSSSGDSGGMVGGC